MLSVETSSIGQLARKSLVSVGYMEHNEREREREKVRERERERETFGPLFSGTRNAVIC